MCVSVPSWELSVSTRAYTISFAPIYLAVYLQHFVAVITLPYRCVCMCVVVSVHVCISRIIFCSVQLQFYNSWKKCDVNEDCTHLKACPPLKYFLQSADISWAREAILRDKQCGYNSYCCRKEGKWLTKSKSFAIIF